MVPYSSIGYFFYISIDRWRFPQSCGLFWSTKTQAALATVGGKGGGQAFFGRKQLRLYSNMAGWEIYLSNLIYSSLI